VIDLEARRRFFAEEIEAVANLRTSALVEALASIPRERFLRPGPWLVRGEADALGPARETPDADPRHTYHNYAIAIDPARQLFNGAPGVMAAAIDALDVVRGSRVLHIGAGLGYYSALLGHMVGETGHVLAIEVDEALVADATANLSSMSWVSTRCGDGTQFRGECFDAILVNAGVTHPHDSWLDALSAGGRLILPLTVTTPAIESTIGKGVMALITRDVNAQFDARVLSFVMIYSAVGLRDDTLNTQLGEAMTRNPLPILKRLRRDAHEAGPDCWFHAPPFCLSLS
jgi:protein-L-isoaspartate(D-aspartate) O-methyltransferase